jgi:diacylglycerol kinase family enzyme
MDISKSLQQILDGKTVSIDSGIVNGIPFFCTSGVGFDAHIGNLFATSIKRGLQSYVRITARELFRYRAKEYELTFNGKTITKKAFLITVANAGQYGNDFYIAPQASMQDGLFHVVVLKPFNPFKVIGLMRRIMGREAFMARSIETYTTSELKITRTERDYIHFDGEPAQQGNELVYSNRPLSLKVIAGESFKGL